MPIVDMMVQGGRCDRCGCEEPVEFDAAETARTLRDLGWQPLAAGLWVCPVCYHGLSDPADFAAGRLLRLRRKP